MEKTVIDELFEELHRKDVETKRRNRALIVGRIRFFTMIAALLILPVIYIISGGEVNLYTSIVTVAAGIAFGYAMPMPTEMQGLELSYLNLKENK